MHSALFILSIDDFPYAKILAFQELSSLCLSMVLNLKLLALTQRLSEKNLVKRFELHKCLLQLQSSCIFERSISENLSDEYKRY